MQYENTWGMRLSQVAASLYVMTGAVVPLLLAYSRAVTQMSTRKARGEVKMLL